MTDGIDNYLEKDFNISNMILETKVRGVYPDSDFGNRVVVNGKFKEGLLVPPSFSQNIKEKIEQASEEPEETL